MPFNNRRPSSGRRLVAAIPLAIVVLLAPPGRRIGASPAEPARAALDAQQGQLPARDQSQQQRAVTGNSSISGRVLAGDSGRPIKRARVAISAPELPGGRAMLTDRDGNFAFTAIPAGRYSITASKSGFVGASFGQRRALGSGRPLELRDKEHVRGLEFRLPRGSVISGRVYDDDGDPIMHAVVSVLRATYGAAGRRLLPAGTGTSDDRGYYRVFGLSPGTYFVSASVIGLRDTMMEFGPGQRVFVERAIEVEGPEAVAATVGFAPAYYPGVATLAEALPVPVALEQELSDINFQLPLVPTVRVSGVVIGADGSAAPMAVVTLAPDEGRGGEFRSMLTGRVQPDGSFVVTDVPPGRYLAVARAPMPRGGGPLFGSQQVTVVGVDVTGVSLTLGGGGRVSGQIVFESASGTTPDLSRVRLSATPLAAIPMGVPAPRIQNDGSFAITNVLPGSYLLQVTAPSPWALTSISLGGRDVSDTPIEVRMAPAVTGVTIALTDRPTEISGTVVDEDNQTVSNCWVIAFPTDEAAWRPLSRQIQSRRSSQSGEYRFSGLPPADYFVVALEDIEEGAWFDPQVLEKLRDLGSRLSLNEGDKRTETLKLRVLDR